MLNAREIPVHRVTEMTDANSSNGNRVIMAWRQFMEDSSRHKGSIVWLKAMRFLDQVNYIQNV